MQLLPQGHSDEFLYCYKHLRHQGQLGEVAPRGGMNLLSEMQYEAIWSEKLVT